MSDVAAQAPHVGAPAGSRWWPGTWIRILIWKWKLAGPVTPEERRGYWFWIPVVAAILITELLGAFDDIIPWPTISETVGHLEKRWDIVAVIVLGLIAMTAFHAIAYRGRRENGRALRETGPGTEDWDWYNLLLVIAVTGLAIVLALVFGAHKYEYGYVLYGVLFGLLIFVPSILAFLFHRLVHFPTLFFTIRMLRRRRHSVAMVIVTGLSILAVHLSFYPWPDITHESASFAGLNPEAARAKAERELRTLRAGKAPLGYSTQARGVRDGADAWYVYFSSGCVIVVSNHLASPSPECSQ